MSASAGLWRVAAWLPAVLVVPAVMAGAVYVSRPVEKSQELRELAPIEVGTTWVYEVYDHGKPSGTRTRQVTGQAGVGVDLLDAVTILSSYTDSPSSGGPYSDLLYLGLEGDSLDQHAVFVGNEHLAIDPPAPAYQLPLEEGNTWSYKGKVGEARLQYEVELQTIEDVEVGGRTFEGCAHFVTVFRWKFAGQKELGPPETQEEWTCPGFGPVRSTQSDPANDVDTSEELVEFHGKAGNWYAEAPAEATGESHPGDTLGFDPGRANFLEGRLDPALAWSDARSARFDFPPVANDEVMVLVERDGEVSAMDVSTGEMRWRVRLTGPVVAAPTIAGDRVLVADSAKQLWALSLTDGTARWVRAFDDMVTGSPSVVDTTAVVPTDDRRVTALDVTDGSTIWQAERSTSVRTAPVVVGDEVVVADRGGEVTSYAVADGAEQWSRALEGGLVAGPTVADGRVLVGDDGGILYALGADDGALVWEERTIFYPSEQFAAGNGTLVSVGDGERVEAYDLDTGAELWSDGVDNTYAAPVIVGDQVVTVDDRGDVTVRGLRTGSTEGSWRLPLPNRDAETDIEVDPALVAGALVLVSAVSAEGHSNTLFAYPVGDEGVRPGVTFDTEVRMTPGSANGVSALAGDVLFTPGFDQALHRSTGVRQTEKVFTTDGFLPGVVPAGPDLVVSQKNDQILALPVDGGEPRWSYDTTDAYPGLIPAVSGDTVFVPQYGTGLAAVSLADGREKWSTAVDLPIGTTPPLPLPDGDVVYGGGALARFDGETGQQRWSVMDGVLFNNAAYDDGLVFADVVRNLTPSGLTAIDAETGETVWFHENVNTQLVVGPEAADGVVVYADSQGLVTAFDAATGAELWRLQLSTGIAGHPVIIDGRVYLSETGREEDIFQREYRVSAHDLQTGQFLGSFQPPGQAFSIQPTIGGNDGAILAPASGRLGPVVMILRPHP